MALSQGKRNSVAGVSFLSTGKCLELCNQNVSTSNGWWSLGTHSEACCGPSGAVLASTLSLASGSSQEGDGGGEGIMVPGELSVSHVSFCLNMVHSSSAPWQAPRKWLGSEWAGDCGTGLRLSCTKPKGETQEQQSRGELDESFQTAHQRRLQFGGNIPASGLLQTSSSSPQLLLETETHTAWDAAKQQTHDWSESEEVGVKPFS